MTNTVRENIKEFYLTNKFLRKVRNYFHQVVFPILFKGLVGLVALLIITFLMLKTFKPVYLEKIYQKSSFYFFHYLNLDNHEFEKVNISGNKRVTKEEILEIVSQSRKYITKDKVGDYQPLIQNLIKEIKQQLPWVDKAVVTRNMPNILNISITEYEPFAIWQNDGKKYLTDKDGNLIPFEDSEEFNHMVVLSGKNANMHAKSLFNIFAIDANLSSQVYSATWVSDRRWDIRFENGLIIKLPEDNISGAWQHLMKIYNMPGSIIGLKIIDLRLLDKIYLEYDDSVIKELQNL
jgi:cell division protein FtsQ